MRPATLPARTRPERSRRQGRERAHRRGCRPRGRRHEAVAARGRWSPGRCATCVAVGDVGRQDPHRRPPRLEGFDLRRRGLAARPAARRARDGALPRRPAIARSQGRERRARPVTRQVPSRSARGSRPGASSSPRGSSRRTTSFPTCRACGQRAQSLGRAREAGNGLVTAAAGRRRSRRGADLAKEAAQDLGTLADHPVEVYREERDPVPEERPGRAGVLVDVALAELDEAAAGREDGEAPLDESPARLFKTTSTPRPPVASSTSSAKSGERESTTCSTPSDCRSGSRFSGLPAEPITSRAAPARHLQRGEADSPRSPRGSGRVSPGRRRASESSA